MLYRDSPFQEIRAQEEKENQEAGEGGAVGGSGEIRVSTNMAYPSNMLTDKEMDCIITVFRSFETGLRGATIYPSVSRKIVKSKNI